MAKKKAEIKEGVKKPVERMKEQKLLRNFNTVKNAKAPRCIRSSKGR